MKYFIIEITKPNNDNNYKEKLQEKINNCDFDVVKVCHENPEKELVKFQIKNVKNQTNKHYEIINGEGREGLLGLKNEIESYYQNIR